MSHYLDVFLHDTLVGHIAPHPRGLLAFHFITTYPLSFPRAVLGQAFEDHLDRAFVGKKAGHLPPFFQNLIPEASGELRPILERHLQVPADDDAALLLALGRDLPGAVVVRPSPAAAPQSPPESSIDDAIAPTTPTDLDTNPLRFSLAGVQLKFSVMLAGDRITLPASGDYGGWLAKFASSRFDGLCENEYATMRWAARAGFDVPELRLLSTSQVTGLLEDSTPPDGKVLLIKRYDRTREGRVHQEDFAQVRNLVSAHKYGHVNYEQLAALVNAIVSPDAALEFVRRLVFVIASGNGDAHLKNWSLVYPDKRQATLSPLYDQVATIAWPAKTVARELALKLVGRQDFDRIDGAVFTELARKARLDLKKVATVVAETLAALATAWNEQRGSDDDTWPPSHREAILEHFQRTPLLAASPLGAVTR